MLLKDTTILHTAQYAAPYAGNFIASLSTLEQLLFAQGASVLYLFPQEAQSQPWAPDFAHRHRVFFLNCPVCQSQGFIRHLIDSEGINLVHTHFEGFDIPVSLACRSLHVKQVWHLHDHLGYMSHPLKAAYQAWCFLNHYGRFGCHANIIAVSPEVERFTERYHRLANFGKGFPHKLQLANGVDETRIISPKAATISQQIGGGTFLAFGGRNISKRVDILMEAGKILEARGLKFKIMITNGTDTEPVARQAFPDGFPDWFRLVSQTPDINSLLAQASCFVSTSAAETFSYAICEASFYGLPVIQSDIPGTVWNATNPSTRLFPSLNPTALANSMEDFLKSDPEQEAKLALDTRERNRTLYPLNTWASKVINFYNSL